MGTETVDPAGVGQQQLGRRDRGRLEREGEVKARVRHHRVLCTQPSHHPFYRGARADMAERLLGHEEHGIKHGQRECWQSTKEAATRRAKA